MQTLQQWCEQNNTNMTELTALILNLDGTEHTAKRQERLNMYCGNDPTETGVIDDNARELREILLDGRNGKCTIELQYFVEKTGVSLQDIMNLIIKAPDDVYMDYIKNPGTNKAAIRSDRVHDLLKDLQEMGDMLDTINARAQAAQQPDEPTAPAPETPEESDNEPDDGDSDAPAGEPEQPAGDTKPAAPAPAAPAAQKKTPARRKTKYTLNKAAAQDVLASMCKSGESDGDAEPVQSVRDLRAFLLSLPEYKPQDVALMGDTDVTKIFAESYKTIAMPNGTLVMSKKAYAQLIDHLSNTETYFVPKPDGNGE